MAQSPVTPSQAVARRLVEIREARGWSQQRVADRCADLGYDEMTRGVVANIESERRTAVSVDELFVLAAALDVTPLALLVAGEHSMLSATPSHELPPGELLDWIVGLLALPGQNDDRYRESARPISRFEGLASIAVEQEKAMAQTAELLDQLHEQLRRRGAEVPKGSVALAGRLREIRRALAVEEGRGEPVPVEEVAERCQLPAAAWEQWEEVVALPRHLEQTLTHVADTLGVDADWLVGDLAEGGRRSA